MLTLLDPLLVNVTVCGKLVVPTNCPTKVKLDGLKVTLEPQFENLKLAIRVFQLKGPLA